MPTLQKAIEFLTMAHPRGPWLLAAIEPDGKEPIKFETFYPEQKTEALDFLEKYNGKRGLYWTVNQVRSAMSTKPSAADISYMKYLHVDIDPGQHRDRTTERNEILAKLTPNFGLPGDIPEPTWIIDSGNGFQAGWLLDEALALDGTKEAADDAKLYNMRLEQLLGGDNCHNIDRLLRLPGTINIPNQKKRDAGRTEQPTALVYFNHKTYGLHLFAKAKGSAQTTTPMLAPRKPLGEVKRINSLEEIEGVDWLAESRLVNAINGVMDGYGGWPPLYRPGEHMPKWYPDAATGQKYDRSDRVWAVVQGLVRLGVTQEIIVGIISDPGWECSAHILDQKGDPIQNAWRQLRKEDPENLVAEADNDLVSLQTDDDLPPRPWLVPGLLMRGQVTGVVAHGGVGKSLLSMQVATMVAAGVPMLGFDAPCASGGVIILNAEDDLLEQRKRLKAACLVAGIDVPKDVYTMQRSSFELITRSQEGGNTATPFYAELIKKIKDNGIHLLIVDPLIEMQQGLDENSNSDMKDLALALRRIARSCNIPVVAIHHTRKGALAGDQDGARGGSAIVNACRIMLTLTTMTEAEFAAINPPEPRRRYAKLMGAKANYTEFEDGIWVQKTLIETSEGEVTPSFVIVKLGNKFFDPLQWDQRERFLRFVADGQWTCKVNGPRTGRLDAQGEAFGISDDAQFRKIIAAYERAQLIKKVIIETAARKPLEIWALGDAPVVPAPQQEEIPF